MTAVLRFELPWPAPALHPNARPHRMAKARSAKKARADAALVTRSSMVLTPFKPPKDARFRVELDFLPSTTRGRDKDNCLGAMKHSLDGIADALGVNDSRFDPVPILQPAKRGRQESVIVTITAVSPTDHPVDVLKHCAKVAGIPFSAEAERQARAICDGRVPGP